MFQIYSWPNVILHLDGDAFFASVMQAVNPSLKGKPIVVGKERGIATAISYEAKKFGVKRGMRGDEIRKICPKVLFITSDYEIYNLFSQKMFKILRLLSPTIEEYSVDEGFADLKGLRRPLKMGYKTIGKTIKDKIESSLGITVSVGISLTKSLAKLASGFDKPSGLTVIDGLSIEKFLKNILLNDVWGIGPQTTAYLNKLNIKTALDFANKPESYIKEKLTKPHLEIWHELRGRLVYKINTKGKNSFKGITKSQTFYPPTSDEHILWARLCRHIESAFKKARRFNYKVGKIALFLKTQEFSYHHTEFKLLEKTSFPLLIKKDLKKSFQRIYKKTVPYRATGCFISNLQNENIHQPSLFSNSTEKRKAKKIYSIYEREKIDFGTSLYDKEELMENKEKKINLPFVSLANL